MAVGSLPRRAGLPSAQVGRSITSSKGPHTQPPPSPPNDSDPGPRGAGVGEVTGKPKYSGRPTADPRTLPVIIATAVAVRITAAICERSISWQVLCQTLHVARSRVLKVASSFPRMPALWGAGVLVWSGFAHGLQHLRQCPAHSRRSMSAYRMHV